MGDREKIEELNRKHEFYVPKERTVGDLIEMLLGFPPDTPIGAASTVQGNCDDFGRLNNVLVLLHR